MIAKHKVKQLSLYMKLMGLLILGIIPKQSMAESTVGSHPWSSISGEWRLGQLWPSSAASCVVRGHSTLALQSLLEICQSISSTAVLIVVLRRSSPAFSYWFMGGQADNYSS